MGVRGRPRKDGRPVGSAPVVHITLSELAKLKGVKPCSVVQAATPSRMLHPAKLPGGGFDRNHPATIAWLNKPRGWKAVQKSGVVPEQKFGLTSGTSHGNSANMRAVTEQLANAPRPTVEEASKVQGKIYADRFGLELDQLLRMNFGSVLERFGSVDSVFGFAKTAKELAYAKKAQVVVAETRGKLVRRDFVMRHVIGALDGFHRRLLIDTAPAIETRLTLAIKAGATPEERRSVVHDLHSAALERAKRELLGAINNASQDANDLDVEGNGDE